MSIDLKKLENKLDEALSNETNETLTKFLTNKRMSNNKQSSVEWFSKESWNLKVKLENKEISIGEYGVTYVDLLQQAKSMHKDEIVNTIVDCEKEHFIQAECYPPQFILTKAEHYYNITFGGNNDIH